MLSNSDSFFTTAGNTIDIAILAPMPEELDCIKRSLAGFDQEIIQSDQFEFQIVEYQGVRLLLSTIGIGMTFAACMLTYIIDHFSPGYVFALGTAGGIKQDLKVKDVVVAESAFEVEMQSLFAAVKGTPFESCLIHPLNKQSFPAAYSANKELLNLVPLINTDNITLHSGIVATSDVFPAPTALFENIKKENACCMDMETSALYQVAWMLGAKILAVRGISNVLCDKGSDENLAHSDIQGCMETASQIVMKLVDQLIAIKSRQRLVEQNEVFDQKAQQLISELDLRPHPEGGYYAPFYRSQNRIIVENTGATRQSGSSIYYLLANDQYSAFHSLKSDEIWHFYKGSTVKLYVIDKNGALHEHLLGDFKMTKDASFQVPIQAGEWFAAELVDKKSYALIGCTVNPGFEFSDFSLADQSLLKAFPEHHELISRFLPRLEI